VHWLLYLGLIVQPVLGFTMTSAFGFPMQGATAYLGLIDLPAVIGKDEALAKTLQTLHIWVGYSIAALLVAHIAGAVYHHAIRRDGTLMRML
jgi:cytochrome b561